MAGQQYPHEYEHAQILNNQSCLWKQQPYSTHELYKNQPYYKAAMVCLETTLTLPKS